MFTDEYRLKRLGETISQAKKHEDGGSLGQTLIIQKFEKELLENGYKLLRDIPNVEGYILSKVYYFTDELIEKTDVIVEKTSKGTLTIPNFEYAILWKQS
jgi:hypothetical protein